MASKFHKTKWRLGHFLKNDKNIRLASLSERSGVTMTTQCKQTRAAFFQWRAEFLLNCMVEYVLEMYTKLFTEAQSHLKPKVYPICELI